MYNSGRATHCFAACQDCLAELAREDRKDNIFVTFLCFPENEHSADKRRIHRDEGVGGGGGGRSRRDEQERLLFRTYSSMVLVARRTCKSV